MKSKKIEDYNVRMISEEYQNRGEFLGTENSGIMTALVQANDIGIIDRNEKEALELLEAAKQNSIDFYKLSGALTDVFLTAYQLAVSRYLEQRRYGKITSMPVPKDIVVAGPPGSGKSSGIEFLADRLGVPVVRIQGGPNLDESVLFGKTSVKNENGVSVTYFEDGLLTKAVKNGYAVILEEADMIKPHIMTQLNTILDRRPYSPTGSDEMIMPHPMFFMALTMNTKGWGNKKGFNSRNPLDPSLMDRLLYCEVDYMSKEMEIDIVKQITKNVYSNLGISDEAFNHFATMEYFERLVSLARQTREKSLAGDLALPLTTRGIAQILISVPFLTNKLKDQSLQNELIKPLYHVYTSKLPSVEDRKVVEDMASKLLLGQAGLISFDIDKYRELEDKYIDSLANGVIDNHGDSESDNAPKRRGRPPKA